MPGSKIIKRKLKPKPEEPRKPVLRISMEKQKFEREAFRHGFGVNAQKALLELGTLEDAMRFVRTYGPEVKKVMQIHDGLLRGLQTFAVGRKIPTKNIPETRFTMNLAKHLLKEGVGIEQFLDELGSRKTPIAGINSFEHALASALERARNRNRDERAFG